MAPGMAEALAARLLIKNGVDDGVKFVRVAGSALCSRGGRPTGVRFCWRAG